MGRHVRISPHLWTTGQDIDRLVGTLATAVGWPGPGEGAVR
jgi:selenocysteine lyase/cysteine desulfurase